jgi:hypothetical protein
LSAAAVPLRVVTLHLKPTRGLVLGRLGGVCRFLVGSGRYRRQQQQPGVAV